jgi:hypothetical protein
MLLIILLIAALVGGRRLRQMQLAERVRRRVSRELGHIESVMCRRCCCPARWRLRIAAPAS